VILDHCRKDDNKGRRRELLLDDIKGTGGKAQNADTIIFLERAGTRQLTFRAMSKDFDEPVGILLNVGAKSSTEPKFKYAGELEKLGAQSRKTAEKNQQDTLGALPDGAEWISRADLAKQLQKRPGAKKLGDSTLRRYLTALEREGHVERLIEGRSVQYRRIPLNSDDERNERNILSSFGSISYAAHPPDEQEEIIAIGRGGGGGIEGATRPTTGKNDCAHLL